MKLDNLKAKRQRLLADATEFLTVRGIKTPALKTEYDTKLKAIDELAEEIELLEVTHTALGTRSQLNGPAPVPVVAAPAVISTTSENEARQIAARKERDINAVRSYLRTGSLDTPEMRDVTTASDVSGEALVRQTFESSLNEAAKFYGPVFDLVNTKTQNEGSPRKFANVDTTAQTFTYLPDTGATSVTTLKQTPSMFSNVNKTDTLISSVVYSVQESDDADDLQGFLNSLAASALGRAREVAVSVGTDTSEAANVLPSSPAGGLLAGIPAGYTQGSLADEIAYQDLVSLAGSVDRAYYVDGVYMASPSVEFTLRAQTDSTGRPFYKTDPETGLLLINGKLLYPNVAMAAAGTASAPLVLFGNLKKAYNVVSRGLRLQVVAENANPNLAYNERMLIISERIGASAGIATSVKAYMSAAG